METFLSLRRQGRFWWRCAVAGRNGEEVDVGGKEMVVGGTTGRTVMEGPPKSQVQLPPIYVSCHIENGCKKLF
jgi:hypothetical protein